MTSARGRWEKRTRTVDVTLEASADGARVVDTQDRAAAAPSPAAEPCYACDCCGSWVSMLELLRANIAEHKPPHPLLGPQCPVERCLVCALGVTW